MAREMPVLPLVGSRIVQPGRSRPSFSACWTIASAARSLIEPVGLRSSSLAHRRTSGLGDSVGSPTRGVPPTELSRSSYLMALAGRADALAGRADALAGRADALGGRAASRPPS